MHVHGQRCDRGLIELRIRCELCTQYCTVLYVLYMYVPVPVPVHFTILGDVANSANKQINTCSVYSRYIQSNTCFPNHFRPISAEKDLYISSSTSPHSHFPPKSRLTALRRRKPTTARKTPSVFMRYHSLICTGRRVFQQRCMSENSCHRAHIEFSSEGDATATAAALTVI